MIATLNLRRRAQGESLGRMHFQHVVEFVLF